MANKTDIIKKLPQVFQTPTEKKFFDATFDQVFSKRTSERLDGYIGRRQTGQYDPINDFYLPEPTKDKTYYQLEPTAFSRDSDTLEKTNQYFYTDMLNKIRFLGGNIGNHDRLFNSLFYSYAPPIDADKFVNYQNYYWIPDKLTPVLITGLTDEDIDEFILGKEKFNTNDMNLDLDNPVVNPVNLQFTSGLRVQFAGTQNYNVPLTIEGVGRSISLVHDLPELLSVIEFNSLPWDTKLILSNQVLDNSRWDMSTWDVDEANPSPDYITMERGSSDRNAWSRTNKWYHVDVINTTISQTQSIWPQNAIRAKRPILEFFKNIQLYKSGSRYLTDVDYLVEDIDAFNQIQGRPLSDVREIYELEYIQNGDLILMPYDTSPVFSTSPWDHDNDMWEDGIDPDPTNNAEWDDSNDPKTYGSWDTISAENIDDPTDAVTVHEYIWKVTIENGNVLLKIHNSSDPDAEGTVSNNVQQDDIVLIVKGKFEDQNLDLGNGKGNKGETWFFEDNVWSQPTNKKVRENQPMLFELYDTDTDNLDDIGKYPDTNFAGSEIFSYKNNSEPDAPIDSVLGMPLEYTDLGQISDIVFENNLQTNRYQYVMLNQLVDIKGYYYYRIINENDSTNDKSTWSFENSWWANSNHSKQRVIDRTVVSNQLTRFYPLSVAPLNNDVSFIDVKIDSQKVNSNKYSYEIFNGTPHIQFVEDFTLELESTVEVLTYTYDMLDTDSNGYFEIPQQLEANPRNSEITEYSFSEFSSQFLSIIENQEGFEGNPLGQSNNYRDSAKDPSEGSFILQNQSSLLKTMFASSESDLDVISAIRFAGDEYVRTKNKFIRNAKMLSDKGFVPTLAEDDIVTDKWIEEILNVIQISKEFSNAFKYSYMISRGTTFVSESFFVTKGNVLLNNYTDLSNPANSLYIYKVVDQGFKNETEELLLLDYDYELVDINNVIEIKFLNLTNTPIGTKIISRLYSNTSSSWIPSTPAKLGMGLTYKPEIILDESYSEPIYVIVGHDGSRTPVYGAYTTSNGVIEPEVIVRNNVGNVVQTSADWRDILLLNLEKRIYNGILDKFRNEYDILLTLQDIKPGKFRVQNAPSVNRYSRTEYHNITESLFSKWATKNQSNYRVNEFYNSDNWKTWNYSSQEAYGENLPGNWRGIYDYYFDTTRPNTNPWEMLGFGSKPSWWDFSYGVTDTGKYGNGTNDGFKNTRFTIMWEDIESGTIRDGNRKGTDNRYSRKYTTSDGTEIKLTEFLPVDVDGNLRAPADMFGFDASGKWKGVDNNWVYGDLAPVEYAWHTSSEYVFSMQEFFYMLKPSEFGEKFWDTENLIIVNNNQIVNSDTLQRYTNSDIVVHAESVNGEIQVKFGYQQYISDRLGFLGNNIAKSFGNKARALDVNLGYKMSSFTNKDTVRLRIESKSTDSSSSSLIVPTNNYQVYLHTSPSVVDYNYSGVIVRSLSNGTYDIFGYDILDQSFNTYPRSNNSKNIGISQGGVPAKFTDFEFNKTYNEGTIVRYNTRFYEATSTHTATSFMSTKWKYLPKLPEVGGISVNYRPHADTTRVVNVPYGTVLNTPQAVFDFLISYGDYLTDQGWLFDNIDTVTNQTSNWLQAGKNFLFWATNGWGDGNSIVLSPSSDSPSLNVSMGYPLNIEKLSNGVYSILNKDGIAISPMDTTINRDDRFIEVVPHEAGTGINYLRVSSAETEHIILLDNITSFNDVIYDPILRTRQGRLDFRGVKTADWIGKLQASGYLIQDNNLIQNFDNIADSFRNYYNTDDFLDNVQLEEAAKHLIGYESREYLDNLNISDDVQFNFYEGYIREKGTQNSLLKILRSNAITDKENINFYEEWALKLSKFGGVCDDNTFEVVIKFDDVRSNPQLVRLDYKRTDTGYVKEIKIFSATTLFNTAPVVIIDAPTLTEEEGGIQAEAVATLGTDGKLSRIDIVNAGAGYTKAPNVRLDTTNGVLRVSSINPLDVLDSAYAIFQPDISTDSTRDDIIDIDIDDKDRWLYGPNTCDKNLVVPLTDNIHYQLPNAGYVHRGDVDTVSFDIDTMFSNWENDNFTAPKLGQTLWMAKNNQEDWGVYELVNNGAVTSILPDLNPDTGYAIIDLDSTAFNNASNRFEKFRRYLGTTFDRDSVVQSGIIRIVYSNEDLLYRYSLLDGNYTLQDVNGNYIVWKDKFAEENLSNAEYHIFENLRFRTREERGEAGVAIVDPERLTWIDDVDGKWSVETRDSAVRRSQEQLIDTSLFENAFLRNKLEGNTIVRLPVYDPFKGLIPGIADQNIDLKSSRDPARYTNSEDERLLQPNNAFDEKEVGTVWWDLSDTRYMYYEQSKSINDDDDTDIAVYRRNYWGKLFPGSTATIYEWTKSNKTPLAYSLDSESDGIVKNTTDYSIRVIPNPVTGIKETFYYFWVSSKTEVPENDSNRTMPIISVQRLLENPKSQGFQWFSPVQYTDKSNSYTLANVDHIISNRNTVLQVNFKSRHDPVENHTQWKLLREGDKFSPIPDHFWNRAVDSLVGYTDLLPADEYKTVNTFIEFEGTGYGVLPVPNPSLALGEQRGIGIRPQQTMFTDKLGARKILVQSANALLETVRIWEDMPDWNEDINTSFYWKETDWYEPGFDESNTESSRQVENLQELFDLISTGDVTDREMIRVYPFTPSSSSRYEIYQFVEQDQFFYLVRREKGTIQLSDALYEDVNSIILRNELRNLLTAFRNNVFIGEYKTYSNLLFFALLNYSFSEQDDLDWVFKTSYITIVQEGRKLEQLPNFTLDLYDQLIDYINNAKAYRTKIRDTITTYESDIDVANGTPVDFHNFVITMDFARVWRTQEDKDDYGINLPYPNDVDTTVTPVQRIDGGYYIIGWDSINYDLLEANLPGFDDVVSVNKNIKFPYESPWDTLVLNVGTGDPDNDFEETGNELRFKSTSFTLPNEPEELAKLKPVENLVIVHDDEVMDIIATPYDSVGFDSGAFDEKQEVGIVSISYRMNITSNGYVEYVRNSDAESTVLVEDVLPDSVSIKVENGNKLQKGSINKPGVVWIDAERIEYTDIVNNTLVNVRRGTKGTSIATHYVNKTLTTPESGDVYNVTTDNNGIITAVNLANTHLSKDEYTWDVDTDTNEYINIERVVSDIKTKVFDGSEVHYIPKAEEKLWFTQDNITGELEDKTEQSQFLISRPGTALT